MIYLLIFWEEYRVNRTKIKILIVHVSFYFLFFIFLNDVVLFNWRIYGSVYVTF